MVISISNRYERSHDANSIRVVNLIHKLVLNPIKGFQGVTGTSV